MLLKLVGYNSEYAIFRRKRKRKPLRMEVAAQRTVTENPSWENKDTLRCGSSFFVLQAYDIDHNSKIYSKSRKKSK